MSYSLRKVEGQLKKAFERAKHQIESGLAKRNEKLGADIGHEKALRGVENAPAIVDASRVEKDSLIQRGRFSYHWEEQDPGDISSQTKVWKIHVPDRRPYPIFLLRARFYLVLRGIPHRSKHKTARAKFKRHMSIRKSLTITEEALQWAGILLQDRNYYKPVSKERGAIRSPWTGKIEKAIEPPPRNGGRIVHAGEVLFVIRVWTKPSISELCKIKTPVGGSVDSVGAKVGNMVDKGQLLIQLESPFTNISPFCPDARTPRRKPNAENGELAQKKLVKPMSFNAREASQRAAERLTNSASARVKQEAERICNILRPTALRDNTGSEAVVSRRIAARLKRVLPRIRKLEARLSGPLVPVEQNSVRKELGKAVDSFFHEVAWDWIHLRLQMTDGPGTFQRMFQNLPRWFRGLVDQAQRRQGLPLGKVPGGLRPFNLKNVTGERRDPHFPGEVIPHHQLPEQQRKGLRPDGLEWIYNF